MDTLFIISLICATALLGTCLYALLLLYRELTNKE